MPVYLVHGFRWPRPLIRIHIIIQNLDDAAAEWLVAPKTTRAMISNFRQIYPDIMPALPNLRFVEQYDPEDEVTKGQPYAYVADVVHEIKLGVDVDEIRGKGVANEQWTALLELRDKLCPGEKIAWFVVICGDEERHVPGSVKEQLDEEDVTRSTNGHGWPVQEPSDGSTSRLSYGRGEQNGTHKLKRSTSIGRGLRKMMGLDKGKEKEPLPPAPARETELRQNKSFRNLRSLTSMRSRDQLRTAPVQQNPLPIAHARPESPLPLPGTAH